MKSFLASWFGFLAARTIVTGAASLHEPRDSASAAGTGLAGTGIYAEVRIGSFVEVGAVTRAVSLDLPHERSAERAHQPRGFRRLQRARLSGGVNPRVEEGFRGLDVSDSRDAPLVHEEDLDWRRRQLRELEEPPRRELRPQRLDPEGIDPKHLEAIQESKLTEAPGVAVHHATSATEVE
jgi:hypothetical protein